MSIQPGRYYIQVRGNESQYLGIGPVPAIYPPIDVPMRLLNIGWANSWTIEATDDNFVTVHESTGVGHYIYKWIKNNDDQLFVSATNPNPSKFEFKSAGENIWTIRDSDEDLFLTKNNDPTDSTQLVFKPADGSDAQLFVAQRCDLKDKDSK